MRIENMTNADRLRVLAKNGQHGHSRKPHNYYPQPNTMSDCPWEWMHRQVGCTNIQRREDGSLSSYSYMSEPTGFGWQEYQRLVAFAARYRRFYHYCTEIAPAWRQVEEIHYADNSTEVVEVDRRGNRRQRMTVAPSGDACF